MEIGKQLLITRGALTTFSIANDIAKYFAIIPAMFVAVFPGLDLLNVMRLQQPAVGDPVGGHLQRDHHRRPDPAVPARGEVPPSSASKLLSRNLYVYGLGGIIAPFVGIKLVDLIVQFLPGCPDMRMSSWIRQHLAAVRALLVLTVITGIAYPLAVWAVALGPTLHEKAEGSIVEVNGQAVGSALIGQLFTDADGNPLAQYFQSRPSAAGDGYDPTATSASNLGPESIVDTPADPALVAGRNRLRRCRFHSRPAHHRVLAKPGRRTPRGGRRLPPVLHPRRCRRGAVGDRPAGLARQRREPDHSGQRQRTVLRRPRHSRHPVHGGLRGGEGGVRQFGEDYAIGQIVPIRGDAPANPAVPADAVTASGSGLDPHISPAYAAVQAARVAAARGITVDQVRAVIGDNEDGRTLGFLGEPRVNVLELNVALDQHYPVRG